MNNLQQFLEEEIEKVTNSPVMIFANKNIVLNAIRQGTKGWEGKYLSEELQESYTRLINKVLDEVKREVEILNKHYLCGACTEGIRNLSHTQQCDYKDEISTIINNLRVK